MPALHEKTVVISESHLDFHLDLRRLIDPTPEWSHAVGLGASS